MSYEVNVRTLDHNDDLGRHTYEDIPRVGDIIQFEGRIYSTDGFEGFGGRHAFKVVEVYRWPSWVLLKSELISRPEITREVTLFVEPSTMKDVR